MKLSSAAKVTTRRCSHLLFFKPFFFCRCSHLLFFRDTCPVLCPPEIRDIICSRGLFLSDVAQRIAKREMSSLHKVNSYQFLRLKTLELDLIFWYRSYTPSSKCGVFPFIFCRPTTSTTSMRWPVELNGGRSCCRTWHRLVELP